MNKTTATIVCGTGEEPCDYCNAAVVPGSVCSRCGYDYSDVADDSDLDTA